MSTGAPKTLEAFDQELAANNLHGQWKIDKLLATLTDGQPSSPPFLWSWDLVSRALEEACGVLPESMTARRNISFINPGLTRRGTTQTMIAGMQMVMPGEKAWAHRHTIGALRFVVEGDPRLYTVVDGEAVKMETNDLILTPHWSWHDHHNESDRAGLWLDVLDSPVVLGLNQTFYEPFGDKLQEQREVVGPSVQRYPWKVIESILASRSSEARSPFDGTLIEYTHRQTGGPALTTLGCYLQCLPPGFETEARRRTSSAVTFVIRGSGATIFDDRTVEWSARDTFVVPNWSRHRHLNHSAKEPALLFSVSDEPLINMLGLYREEPFDTRQLRVRTP